MKMWKWSLLLLLPVVSTEASGYCKLDSFEKEKNIIKKYQILHEQKKCKIKNSDYLTLTKQAYLSGNYSIGIWASRAVIKKKNFKEVEHLAEYYYYLGISLLGKNRTEEAISTLKKIVFHENLDRIDIEILKKSHMALIQAYYENNQGNKNEKNINYLIRLFKNRHKNSTLVFNIHNWNNNRYLSQK